MSAIGRFLTPLRTERLGRGLWKVFEPLEYESPLLGSVVTVPAGYVTDFASVPRFLPVTHSLFGNRAHAPAVVHDFLYQTHITTRATADAVFREAMKADGQGRIASFFMWAGVRVGGWNSYRTGPRRKRIIAEGGNQ